VKNVVLFVGSGLGPAGVTLARSFQEVLRKGDASVPTTLAFEPYLTATLRTRSYDKYPIPTACRACHVCGRVRWWRLTLCRDYSATTDAAAAATALATGKKTDNGMAAIDPQSKAKVASILESARQAGLKTGNAALRSELSSLFC
jgi:alkaline phosphatase